ncbi:MAG: hypothetical protein DRQ13_08275, partial [Ignavibacteriae bacterium]
KHEYDLIPEVGNHIIQLGSADNSMEKLDKLEIWYKKAFVKALQKLVPDVQLSDIAKGSAGVRAQALEPNGKLVDDFRIAEAKRMVHVLNAPSPAATASISIGNRIAQMVMKKFEKEV